MDKSVEPSKSVIKPVQFSLALDDEENRGETHAHQSRTPGLKLLDVFIYPILTNFSVFAISVAATYLTAKGGMKDESGKLIYGKIGEWFQSRGTKLAGFFRKTGMTEKQADMSKMVFFSFADGSVMAPFVKLLEDRREEIGRFLDEKMGTVPDDPHVYDREPKQTWLSVLGGRFLTASIVVPTAVALDKSGLNDKLFNNPGKQMGEWLSSKPTITKLAGHLDVKEISRVSFFEAFYTTVCTAGLYISSRCLARATGKKSEELPKEEKHGEVAPAPVTTTQNESSEPMERHASDDMKKPRRAEAPAGFKDRYHNEASHQSMSLSI